MTSSSALVLVEIEGPSHWSKLPRWWAIIRLSSAGLIHRASTHKGPHHIRYRLRLPPQTAAFPVPPELAPQIIWNARILLWHSSNRRFTSSPRMPGAPFRGELNQGESGKCVCRWGRELPGLGSFSCTCHTGMEAQAEVSKADGTALYPPQQLNKACSDGERHKYQ